MANANTIDPLLPGINGGIEAMGSALQDSLWEAPFQSQGRWQGQITVFSHVFDVLSQDPGQLSRGNKRMLWQHWPHQPRGLPPFAVAVFPRADLCSPTHGPHQHCDLQCQNLSPHSTQEKTLFFFPFFFSPQTSFVSWWCSWWKKQAKNKQANIKSKKLFSKIKNLGFTYLRVRRLQIHFVELCFSTLSPMKTCVLWKHLKIITVFFNVSPHKIALEFCMFWTRVLNSC